MRRVAEVFCVPVLLVTRRGVATAEGLPIHDGAGIVVFAGLVAPDWGILGLFRRHVRCKTGIGGCLNDSDDSMLREISAERTV